MRLQVCSRADADRRQSKIAFNPQHKSICRTIQCNQLHIHMHHLLASLLSATYAPGGGGGLPTVLMRHPLSYLSKLGGGAWGGAVWGEGGGAAGGCGGGGGPN